MVLTKTAYEFESRGPHEHLAKVGRGTPYGEVLRRYWQPVALSSDATTTPKQLRILGEDLVLFRTGEGRPGLVLPACAHRGASLFYGGVEDDGLRCCYHGWKFDPEGFCLDQPCEPEGGQHRDRVRQPWYPVREYHGMVFSYMGPSDRVPAFPTFDVLHDCSPGEVVVADDSSFGGGGPADLDFNWLEHWENVMDPFHVPILHARFSGVQFVSDMAAIPEVTFEHTETGVRSIQMRRLEDGRRLLRISEVRFPNIRLVASPKLSALGPAQFVGWAVPFDDHHFRVFTLARVSNPDYLNQQRSQQSGKPWSELTPAEHRDFPGDYEAQKGTGGLNNHADDTLGTTDQGVTMLRRMMNKQIKHVADGDDPAGVVYEQEQFAVRVEAGNYIEGTAEAEAYFQQADAMSKWIGSDVGEGLSAR